MGRGGGREYSFDALPPAAQAALLAREALLRAEAHEFLVAQGEVAPEKPAPIQSELEDEEALARARAEGDARAAQLVGKARARMDARLAILRAYDHWLGSRPATKDRRYRRGGLHHKTAFIAAWNEGTIAVEGDARSCYQELSGQQLDRWLDQLHRAGLARLAGQYGHRKGVTLIDTQPQLAAALRALLLEKPHVRAHHAREWLAVRYEASAVQIPALRTVGRWLSAWKQEHAELYCRLSDPDRWKSTYQLAWGEAGADVERLNQRWEFDSTPADLLLVDGRHSLIGVIDVYSRRAKLHVSKTSKAVAVAHLTRAALLDWGVPEVVKTDNGQDYVSHHVTRIFQSLGIDHKTSAPFSPWEKPFIERFFRTFSHDVVELLPGYIGHDVAERQRLRAREQFSDRLFVKNSTVELAELTAADLQAICDRWLTGYHARPHGGLADRRPLEMVAAWRAPVRVIADERALDLLLAEAPHGDGWCTVQKGYGLRLDGHDYLAPELGLYVKQRVRVLYDPEDLGRVYCFDDQGRFIAVAECPELTGLDRREVAARAKALQQQHVRDAVRDARQEARAITTDTAAEEVLAARERAASALVAFPGPTLAHDTPHLAGAGAALRGETVLGPDGPTPELLQAIGPFPQEPPAEARVLAFPEPARVYNTEFERCMDVYLRSLRGLEPDADDLYVLREFYRSAGPNSRRMLDDAVQLRIPAERFAALKQRWLAAAESAVPRQEAG